MAEKEKEVKVKPKPGLVRLNGSPSPGMLGGRVGGQNFAKMSTFKAPRDLTLGAAQAKTPEKKKFVPVLVSRNVKREGNSEVQPSSVKQQYKNGENRRHGGVKKEKQDRREKTPLIQTTGSVFAEGMGSGAAAVKRRAGLGSGGGGGGGRDEGGGAVGVAACSRDEEARLQEMMRDDFIDDLKSGDCVPTQLPMIDTGKMFEDLQSKSDPDDFNIKDCDEDDIKPTNRRGIAKIDSDDDEDPDDIKPPLASLVPPLKPVKSEELSVGDLIRGGNSGDLFFVQLPDHLPGEKTEGEGGVSACHLDSLAEGLVGKLQIRRSGACQLVLGDHLLNVEVGTKVGFLQEAVAVEVPEEEEEARGRMTVVGHVSQRLVVTPDWDSIMDRSGLSSTLA